MERRLARARVLKWVAYAGILLLLFCIQTAVGVLPRPLGMRMNALPFLITALAIFEEPLPVAVAALCCGLLLDGASAGPDGLFLAWYTLTGVLAAVLAQRYFRRVFAVCVLLGMAALLLENLLAYFFYYAMAGLSLSDGLFAAFGQPLYSALASPFVYYPVRAISRSVRPE